MLREVHRWHSVSISPETFNENARRKLLQGAPSLISFSLDLSLYNHKHYPSQPIDLFGGIAPRLRTLELVAVPIAPTSAILRALTSLSLTFPRNLRLSTSEVLDLLQQGTDLAMLWLSDRHSPTWGPATSGYAARPIQLAKLLRLTLDYLDADMYCSLLGSISAPSCTELKLSSLFNASFATIPMPSSDQFSHSFPTLFGLLQAAETVTIVNPNQTIIELMLPAEGALCSLEFQDYDLALALDWVDQIAPGLQEKKTMVKIEQYKDGDSGVLETLDARLNVAELWVSSRGGEPLDMEDLLSFLTTPDTNEGTITRWSFPNLTSLTLVPCDVEPHKILEDVLEMVNSRYGHAMSRLVEDISQKLPKPFNLLQVSNFPLGSGVKERN